MKMLRIVLFFAGLQVACASSSDAEDNFKTFKARNGVSFEYLAILPPNYSSEREYQGLLCFTAMIHDREMADYAIDHIWSEVNENWIVFLPLAPKTGRNGWINHPAHHALEDFLSKMATNFPIKNRRFHAMGYKDGHVPAETYLSMSARYIDSYIVASSTYVDRFEELDFTKMKRLNKEYFYLVGANDKKGLEFCHKVKQRLNDLNFDRFHQIVVAGGDADINSVFSTETNDLLAP